ncbi:hypothetical protein KQI65_06430 [bacterium]|nr:hypothetical protein [bacterium]
MKRYLPLLITLLFVTVHLSAQQPVGEQPAMPRLGAADKPSLDLAAANYALALQSDNDGLVESALYYLTCMRLAYPTYNLDEVSTLVDSLVTEGKTESIRFKAYLTSAVFDAPASVDCEQLRSTDDILAFFVSISNQLQHRLLVQKN